MEAALELDLAVEQEFPGRLVVREGRLRDGMPYVEVLRPFTGMPPDRARESLSYVRVGISLREVGYEWRGEVLLTVGVGLGAVAFVALLAVGVGLWVRPRAHEASRPLGHGEEAEAGAGGGKKEGEDTGRALLRIGALTLDPQAKEVRYRGEKVELSPKEYELLRVLATEPGRVFSTREILERVWTNVPGATAKDVKQYIYLLRRKLERRPERPQLIVTVRGFGYKLMPLEPEAEASDDRNSDYDYDHDRRNREDGRKPSKSGKEGDRR